ncbi:MAG TPA: ABC transporter permease [Steroidobacteraceae bacterium]|nr:ABC transporter permease [Steroidobacteraceae bacterium]
MRARRIFAVTQKEIREILRDRIYLLLAFIMPVMLMIVFGYGMSQDIENVALAVVDEDGTATSRDYSQRFIESRYFAYEGHLRSTRDADRVLANGRIKVVLVIPHHFAERLSDGKTADVQMLVDGSFTTIARTVHSYLDAMNTAYNAGLESRYLSARLGIAQSRAVALIQPVKIEVRYLYNQEARSIWSTAPSLMMFTLMLVVPLLTSLSVVREKESGAIYNVYASTISRGELIAGKLLPSVAIAALNACVLWLIATHYFGAPFKGSLALLALGTLLFIVCAAGFGLVISFLVRTQQAAIIVTTILATLLAMQYSGIMTPISSMTGGTRAIAYAFPPMYYENIIKGTFMKGVGTAVLWPDLLFLLGFAAAVLVAAYALFHKRVRS